MNMNPHHQQLMIRCYHPLSSWLEVNRSHQISSWDPDRDWHILLLSFANAYSIYQNKAHTEDSSSIDSPRISLSFISS